MNNSILTTVKLLLGIEPTYTAFDSQLIVYINSVFSHLQQMGIGPETGYSISSANNTWNEFIGGRIDIELVKTYVYLKVRMMFDPPAGSFVVDSFERIIAEHEWRLVNSLEINNS